MQDKYFGYKALLEGLGQALENRQNRLAFQAQQQAQKEEEERVKGSRRKIFKARGIPESLVDQPMEFQKMFLKESFRPKGFVEKLRERFLGNPNVQVIDDEQGNPVGVQMGNNMVPIDEITPEMLQQLQGPEQSSIGSRLGNLLTGAAGTVAGMPGDIASLGLKGIDLLSQGANKFSLLQNELLDRTLRSILKEDTQQPNPLNAAIRQQIESSEPRALENLQSILPTSHNILEKVVPAVTKGTNLEKYTVPQNETDKWWQDIGGMAGLLATPTDIFTNPIQTVSKFLSSPGKSAAQAAKKIFQSLGIAIGADTAGWATEELTGSKTAGNVVKAGAFTLGSLFPGLARNLSKKFYGEYNNKIIKPAQEAGKGIDKFIFKDKYKPIEKHIEDTFRNPNTKLRKFLDAELGKLENIASKDVIDPEVVWNNIKEINQYDPEKIPVQAQGILKQLKEAQADVLKEFSDSIAPNGGKLWEQANDLHRTAAQISDDLSFIKQATNVRNVGLGTAIWFAGGNHALIASAAAAAGKKFISNMLNSPTIRSIMKELAVASAAKNGARVNQLMTQLNKQSEKELKRLPSEDQKKIREVLENKEQKPAV